MQILYYEKLTQSQKEAALQRPVMSVNDELKEVVFKIISDVRQRGDEALIEQALNFDKAQISSIKVSKDEIQNAEKKLDNALKEAIKVAYVNIKKFHEAQIFKNIDIETMSGVRCELVTRPIEKVGLYIPGGLAPLFSTALMLAIPAKIAACKKIVLASPAKINDAILFVANLCQIDEVYQMGGAGAIAALAYGTKSVCKVDKIFGPGNAFVTEAKRQVSADIKGASIDMQAGPSELLVIADEKANAEFIALDLLSQTEHGTDSQVILLCTDENLALRVSKVVEKELQSLPRKEIAQKSIANSRIIIAKNLDECVQISNDYAPEHLIIQTAKPRELLAHINNAGSVFLGAYSPESMGDYASGTNHVLPTYGLTRTHSSLNLSDFSKKMTIQELSQEGFKNLAPSVAILAENERLDAHKRATSIRLKALN